MTFRNSRTDKIPEAAIYGPIVQGNKNTVTKIPIKNPPLGEVIFATIFFILGLMNMGISVPSPPGLYQIASLMFSMPSSIPKTPTILNKYTLNPPIARAILLNNPMITNPYKKYNTYTAKIKANPVFSTDFLLLVAVSTETSTKARTAIAHGLTASAAANNKIPLSVSSLTILS